MRVEPKRKYSDGEDACELVKDFGFTPDPWQEDILEAWLGRDEYDKFTATSCGLSVPRQNGKNALLEFRELYGLVCIGEKILHTAHEVKTARKAFDRLASYFTDPDHPELTEMLLGGSEKKGIRRTNGQEAIKLENGGSIEFSARSKGAARGFTVDVVVYDEASFLTDDQVEAIMSTMAAAPLGNRQLIYTGTPPSPSMPCEVFGRVRKAAISGNDKRACWHEWSIAGDEEPTMEAIAKNKDYWYRCNPALGIRLDEEFTESEMNTMSPDGFARERLGYWADETGSTLISPEMWNKCATNLPPQQDKIAYGVKFSPDGAMVALAVAVKPKEGKPYVEVIDYKSMREGTSWLANWLIERKSKASVVVIDGRAHTDALVAQMREGNVPRAAIFIPKVNDVISSATRFFNAIKEQSVQHYAQPLLDDVALKAIKRPIGKNGGWGWSCNDELDPAPIEAVSLALWGVMTTKRNPNRKLRIG